MGNREGNLLLPADASSPSSHGDHNVGAEISLLLRLDAGRLSFASPGIGVPESGQLAGAAQ